MHDLNESDLASSCRDLFQAFRGVLSWKWDSRFETVLAECGEQNKDSARAILELYFGIPWDKSNISKAPETVRIIDRNLGSLMSGQLLFTTDPNQDIFVFSAWWPWNDGKTVSIRIAPFSEKLSDSEKAELITLFKGWFGT